MAYYVPLTVSSHEVALKIQSVLLYTKSRRGIKLNESGIYQLELCKYILKYPPFFHEFDKEVCLSDKKEETLKLLFDEIIRRKECK